MRLGDWLARERMSGTELARRLGVDDATVNRLIPRDGKKQVRRPSWDLVRRIHDVTEGAVTANDFMSEDQPPRDAAE